MFLLFIVLVTAQIRHIYIYFSLSWTRARYPADKHSWHFRRPTQLNHKDRRCAAHKVKSLKITLTFLKFKSFDFSKLRLHLSDHKLSQLYHHEVSFSENYLGIQLNMRTFTWELEVSVYNLRLLLWLVFSSFFPKFQKIFCVLCRKSLDYFCCKLGDRNVTECLYSALMATADTLSRKIWKKNEKDNSQFGNSAQDFGICVVDLWTEIVQRKRLRCGNYIVPLTPL